MKPILILLALVFAACGKDADSGTSGASLDDTRWEHQETANCGTVIAFFKDSVFNWHDACVNGNAINTEIVIGTYALTDNILTLTPEKYSCPDKVEPMSYDFVQGDNTISIKQGSRLVIFDALKDSGGESSGGATMTSGCYIDGSFTGRFQEREVLPIAS